MLENNSEKVLGAKMDELERKSNSKVVNRHGKQLKGFPNIEHLESPTLVLDVILGKPDYVHDYDLLSHNYYPLRRLFNDLEIVDWFASPEGGQLGEMQKYKISSISTKDKISPLFGDCTGVVATGQKKENGEVLSLLTHANPKNVLGIENDDFLHLLENKLTEFREQTIDGTIDVVLVGGKILLPSDINYNKSVDIYTRSIIALGEVITEKFSFAPRVVLGPSGKERKAVDLLLETQSRKLYIMGADKREKLYGKNKTTRDISFKWSEVGNLTKEFK